MAHRARRHVMAGGNVDAPRHVSPDALNASRLVPFCAARLATRLPVWAMPEPILRRPTMRYFAVALFLSLGLTAAHAQQGTCKSQAAEKKLAGAALSSFMTKCQKDAGEACSKQATEKKLAGAAKTSFTKKCVKDATGT
jgi:hypothetical protein